MLKGLLWADKCFMFRAEQDNHRQLSFSQSTQGHVWAVRQDWCIWSGMSHHLNWVIAGSINHYQIFLHNKQRKREITNLLSPCRGRGGWWCNCEDHNIHSLITSSPSSLHPRHLQKIQNCSSGCLCLLCNCYKIELLADLLLGCRPPV